MCSSPYPVTVDGEDPLLFPSHARFFRLGQRALEARAWSEPPHVGQFAIYTYKIDTRSIIACTRCSIFGAVGIEGLRRTMSTPREDVIALLDAFERDPDGRGPFIGQRVSDLVRAARYLPAWLPLVERYGRLVAEDKATANARLYCDMACTVVTKKVLMVDLFYLYGPPDGGGEDDEYRRLREIHTTTATAYLVKMLNCVHECVRGRVPDRTVSGRAATLLYAKLYSEAFDPRTVREEDVFQLVQKWFCTHVLQSGGGNDGGGGDRRWTCHNVAPGVPFLVCSHVYWLWLHLTAARVRDASRDLLTVVYALDTIVYCHECKTHFLDHRAEYFSGPGDFPNGDPAGCFTRYTNPELLLRLHNAVNAATGAPEVGADVLSDYRSFWEGWVGVMK